MNRFFIFLEEAEAVRPESIPGSLPGGRAQTGAGQKGQKKTQNEKERKRTGMHLADGIVGNRPGSPESCASVRSSTGNIDRYKSLL